MYNKTLNNTFKAYSWYSNENNKSLLNLLLIHFNLLVVTSSHKCTYLSNLKHVVIINNFQLSQYIGGSSKIFKFQNEMVIEDFI